MFKHISICVLLVALGAVTASAQQREGVLQKLSVPGADFDIVVAMPKAGGAIIEQHGLPDPLVINLAGTELAMAVDGEVEKMVKDIGLQQMPICTFYVDRKSGIGSKSAAVYVVPKDAIPAAPVR